MRVTKGLLFILAALVGLLALAVPAQAQNCENPDKVKFADAAKCLVDLNVKWNWLVTTLAHVSARLASAVNSIEDACDDLGTDGEEGCEGSGLSDEDLDSASQNVAEALADLDIALSLLEEAAEISADFSEELAGFVSKLPNIAFSNRNRNSIQRMAQTIDSLVGKVLQKLVGDSFGDGVGGVEGSINEAMTDLEDAAAELEAPDADSAVASDLLVTALDSVKKAITAKDLALKKHLSLVKTTLRRIQTIIKIAQRSSKHASEGMTLLSRGVPAQVYTLNGTLVGVTSGTALSLRQLANGVYVVVYTEGSRTRVEKLVVGR